MDFTIKTAERYSDFPFKILQISTNTSNADLHDGELAVVSILENTENPLDYIDDNDLIVLKGGAGTETDAHLVRVKFDNGYIRFLKTSDFINPPVAEITKEDFSKAGIIGKVLFTISQKTVEPLRFLSNKK